MTRECILYGSFEVFSTKKLQKKLIFVVKMNKRVRQMTTNSLLVKQACYVVICRCQSVGLDNIIQVKNSLLLEYFPP